MGTRRVPRPGPLAYVPRFFSPHHLALVAGVYLVCLVLHLLVPARQVSGYACDRKGKPLKYSEVFQLVASAPGQYYLNNVMFRFNYA